jgi:hypothetical protein
MDNGQWTMDVRWILSNKPAFENRSLGNDMRAPSSCLLFFAF